MNTIVPTDTIPVRVYRTKMVGGGNSYDVLVETCYKEYHPIAGHIYSTIVCRDGKEFFSVHDMLRDRENDKLGFCTDERTAYFKALDKRRDEIEISIAQAAFPELSRFRKLPSLWTDDNYESDMVEVEIDSSVFNPVTF